jgi:hypothetical protein
MEECVQRIGLAAGVEADTLGSMAGRARAQWMIALLTACGQYAPNQGTTDGGMDSNDAAVNDGSASSDASATDGKPPTDYATEVLRDAPIIYFGFEGDLSNVTNAGSLGKPYNGNGANLAKGSACPAKDGGGCVVLNGTSSFIGISGPALDFAGVKPFSLEAWVALTKAPTLDFRHIFDRLTFSPERTQFGIYMHKDQGTVFERYAPAGASAGVPTAWDTAWHHIVATYDGQTLRLYRDGAIAGSAAQTQMAKSTAVDLFIGRNTAGDPTSYLDATIDEIAVYDKALTPDRVREHYRVGAP